MKPLRLMVLIKDYSRHQRLMKDYKISSGGGEKERLVDGRTLDPYHHHDLGVIRRLAQHSWAQGAISKEIVRSRARCSICVSESPEDFRKASRCSPGKALAEAED